MEFYSAAFIGFVTICLIIHEITGIKADKYQWIVRLVVSVIFYCYIANLRVILLFVSALTVWAGAVRIQKIDSAGKLLLKTDGITKEEKKIQKKKTLTAKRIVLAVVLFINFSLLFSAKYILPAAAGMLLKTLGISFYTLMAVSYVVDVYGGKYKAEQNLAKVMLYLFWFPALIQGPINRFNLLSETLFKGSRMTWDIFKKAALLFLFGAVKKYSVSNVLAGAVGEIFAADLSNKPGGYLFFGAFLFALMQYCDFSGGIDMMLAVSNLFGVRMSENFKRPYFSKSISEFWRRWHITLGSFMRDYVFYPLATTKLFGRILDKSSKKYGKHFGRALVGGISNIIVFFLVGLWHGSELHFILWGLYNGVIIAISDFLDPAFKRMKGFLHIRDDNRFFVLFQMLRTFILIMFAGYFDIVNDVGQSINCFKNTLLHFEPALSKMWIQNLFDCGVLSLLSVTIVSIACLLVLVVSIMKECGCDVYQWIKKIVFPARWIIVYAMIILLLVSFTVVSQNIGFMYGEF